MSSRVFVGFSSTDIRYYQLLRAWKAHPAIPFTFTDCQLHNALNSDSEAYIKRRCRERIDMAGTYMMLIGEDTRHKHKYVRWEAEVAIEKGCRIIGVNVNGRTIPDPILCPPVLRNVGAIFVPFSRPVIGRALVSFDKQSSDAFFYRSNGQLARFPQGLFAIASRARSYAPEAPGKPDLTLLRLRARAYAARRRY